MKKPGRILKLSDGRTVILYNNQPLLQEKGMVILNLIDADYNLLTNEQGNPRTIIQAVEVFNELDKELIGYID
jgi:hypothetical protein